MGVLVVDDDDATADALCELLREEGFDAEGVPDGQRALDYMRDRDVCLVLLDLMMPVMNGYEFRRQQLKDERLAEVPVVVVSADARRAERTANLNAAGYIAKPIEPDELIRMASQFCRKTG
jgi:CheY-like chemotaxis protein